LHAQRTALCTWHTKEYFYTKEWITRLRGDDNDGDSENNFEAVEKVEIAASFAVEKSGW